LYGKDFTRRDNKTNHVWKKGIGKTTLVHAAGFHEFASCRLQHYDGFQSPSFREGGTRHFDEDSRLRLYEGSDVCKDLNLVQDFGTMHHFFDTNVFRTYILEEDYLKLPIDEYSSLYANTVKAQLVEADFVV
jgi:hypothetical protein